MCACHPDHRGRLHSLLKASLQSASNVPSKALSNSARINCLQPCDMYMPSMPGGAESVSPSFGSCIAKNSHPGIVQPHYLYIKFNVAKIGKRQPMATVIFNPFVVQCMSLSSPLRCFLKNSLSRYSHCCQCPRGT